jgi:hypothetical protein
MTVFGEHSVGANLGTDAAVLAQNNTLAIVGGSVGINTLAPASALDVSGSLRTTNIGLGAASDTVWADFNDYAPAVDAAILYLYTTGAYSLNGLTAGYSGQIKIIINTGTYVLSLAHEANSSLSSNQFFVSSLDPAPIPPFEIEPNQKATLIYDTAIAKWRVFA